MIRKLLPLAVLAGLLCAQPAAAQFVYYPGWFKTMPNGSTLTDTANGTIQVCNSGATNCFTAQASGGGQVSFGGGAVFGGQVVVTGATNIQWSGRTQVQAPAAGLFSVSNTAATKDAVFDVSGTPTPTGTGTPTIATGSTNFAGEVTAGASATSIVITFAGAPLATAPFCVVTDQSLLAAFSYVISTSAITITQTATSGNKVDYLCVNH